MSLALNTAGLYSDIFEQPILDRATEERRMTYLDNGKSRAMTAADTDYSIQADLKSKMFYLAESFLEIKLEGATSNAAAQLAKLRFALSPFLKRARLLINGTTVEDIADVQIAGAARMLTENSRPFNETVLSQIGYASAPASDTRQLIKVAGQRVLIPLWAIFLSVKNMPMLYGCELRIELSRNVFNDQISHNDHAASGTASTTTDLYFADVRLAMPIYVPTPVQKAAIEERLVAGFEREFIYEWGYVKTSNKIIAANPSESFTVSGGVPVRLYLAPVADDHEAAATQDRTTFLPGSADSYFSRVNVRVDGKRVLERDLENPARLDAVDFWRAYLDHLRKQDHMLGSALTYEEFRNYYQLICVDLAHQEQTLYDSGRAHDIVWDISSVHGSTASTADYRLYTVVIMQAKMKIKGSDGQITVVK